MKIRVIVLFESMIGFEEPVGRAGVEGKRVGSLAKHVGYVVRDYTMDHNDPAQRRVLGEQVRNAFEAGQCVITYPVAS